mgnify:CR=1 FL=1
MKKSEEILEKHIVLNDCIGYLGSDGRLYKAIIDALNEAINYTHSCTELPSKQKSCVNGIDSDTCRHNSVCDYC